MLNFEIRLALNYIYFPFHRYSDTVCDEAAFKAISFESIFTAFIVLAFGIGVALLSVILEKFWNKPEKNKRNPGRDVGKFAIKKWNQFVINISKLVCNLKFLYFRPNQENGCRPDRREISQIQSQIL